MYFFSELSNSLLNSAIFTIIVVGPIFAPLLLLGLLMHFISGSVRKNAWLLLGGRAYLFIFGWLGTLVHESGHAIMCIVFRHRITEIKFFSLDPANKTLGYVKHSWNPKNLFQVTGNFFIGAGPLILGAFVIYGVFYLLLPQLKLSALNITIPKTRDFASVNALLFWTRETASCLYEFLRQLFLSVDIQNWQPWLTAYILFSVGSAMKLSRADIKGSGPGFLLFIIFIFLLSGVLMYLGLGREFAMYLSGTSGFFFAVMLICVFLNFLILLQLMVLRKIIPWK